ncbi:MAG: hypothetical protein D6731_17995 [Planctomycetota bacterium]|nr:MAG: hypothetical protein D6731_17995 [Planctomycetota bacterium]
MKRRPVFGATTWDLIEVFFAAQRQYQRVYSNYETRVLAHAEQQAVDRHQLRLEAEEVSKLLDFRSLGELRNGPLQRTKEISHALFRSEGRTQKFDRYVSEIYHELSILREEQYKVSTFADAYKRENELAAYESILDEVHEDFPRRVHNIWGLFQKAQLSLEILLRPLSRDPIYLRSLYLFGDRVLGYAYRLGRRAHCWRVFDHGQAEASLLAARSFARSGFKEQALEAAAEAKTEAERGLPKFHDGAGTAEGLAQIAAEAADLVEFVSARSPAELVESSELRASFPANAFVGDDAAPGLSEDFPSSEDLEADDFSAETSDVGFV